MPALVVEIELLGTVGIDSTGLQIGGICSEDVQLPRRTDVETHACIGARHHRAPIQRHAPARRTWWKFRR